MSATDTGVELKRMSFCEDSESYCAEYDAETTSPSMAIITVITKVSDVAPTELSPLHYSIDTEALDEFVGSRDPAESTVQISFTLAECEITATSDCKLSVTPLADSTGAPVRSGDGHA